MRIPDWLPTSSKLECNKDKLEMGVNYRVAAQYQPESNEDLLSETRCISKFYGFTEIMIVKPEP